MDDTQPTRSGGTRPIPPSSTSSGLGSQGIEPSRLGAAGSRAVGILLYVVAFAGILIGAQAGLAGLVTSCALAMVLIWIAARVLLRAKRQAAPNAQTLLARDARPPVVYLRSFTSDRTTARGVTFSSWFTEEEQLARALRDVGPLVAIGEPGEVLPPVGAARVYVGTDDWQQVVQNLTARAALVMLRIGQTPGLYWEFESIRRQARPERVALIVPRDERVYEEFRTATRTLLPSTLPAIGRSKHHRLFRGSLRAVITFDQHWRPMLVNLDSISLPLLQRSPAYPLVPVLEVALAPALRRLGLARRPARYSFRMIVTIISLLIMVVCLVVVFAL